MVGVSLSPLLTNIGKSYNSKDIEKISHIYWSLIK